MMKSCEMADECAKPLKARAHSCTHDTEQSRICAARPWRAFVAPLLVSSTLKQV